MLAPWCLLLDTCSLILVPWCLLLDTCSLMPVILFPWCSIASQRPLSSLPFRCAFVGKQYKQAVEHFSTCIELDPGWVWSPRFCAFLCVFVLCSALKHARRAVFRVCAKCSVCCIPTLIVDCIACRTLNIILYEFVVAVLAFSIVRAVFPWIFECIVGVRSIGLIAPRHKLPWSSGQKHSKMHAGLCRYGLIGQRWGCPLSHIEVTSIEMLCGKKHAGLCRYGLVGQVRRRWT